MKKEKQVSTQIISTKHTKILCSEVRLANKLETWRLYLYVLPADMTSADNTQMPHQ